MSPSSSSSFSFSFILLTTVLIATYFPVAEAVRPESNSTASVIRLPSEGISSDDICAGKVTRTSCPVNCFRTDPVCGVDGVTYWCGCADAQCAGTRVAKLGFCEIGNGGGSDTVSGQALLLVHIVWLILLGFSVLFGLL